MGDKERLRKKISHMKTKLNKKYMLLHEFSSHDFTKIINECDDYDLSRKVKDLSDENQDLQELVSLLEDDEVVTFHDGRYCNEIREVIMCLLSMNVSMRNIDGVIKCVLKKLAKKDIGRLPSLAIKSRIQEEALILAQMQVGEEMIKNENYHLQTTKVTTNFVCYLHFA